MTCTSFVTICAHAASLNSWLWAGVKYYVYRDGESNKIFYVNTETRDPQWNDPREILSSGAESSQRGVADVGVGDSAIPALKFFQHYASCCSGSAMLAHWAHTGGVE